MKTASIAQVKARLDSYLKDRDATPMVVTRNGKPVAVLLAVNDDGDVKGLLASKPRKLAEILEAADRRIDEGAGIPHDEFWQRVEASQRSRKANGKKRPAKR
ncbi:MAG: type II toxin-antitoxin system Phd/YefM family antitoxin [Planctomycetes bacterium]|nr:type II toxin-antitoxin system Phd/YefM family antitoxin [Planctomycetota bacterium]